MLPDSCFGCSPRAAAQENTVPIRLGDLGAAGSRLSAALFQMRPRWQRERDGEITDRAMYADSKSQAAAAFKDDLAAFHAHFIREEKEDLG